MCLGLFMASVPATVHANKPPSQAQLQELNRHIRAAEADINKKKGESGKLQDTLRKTELDMSKVERDVKKLSTILPHKTSS